MNNLNITEENEKNNNIISKIHLHQEEGTSTNLTKHVNKINDKNEIYFNSSIIKKNKEKSEDFNKNLALKKKVSIRENNYNNNLSDEQREHNTIHLNNTSHNNSKNNLVNNNLNNINNLTNNSLNRNYTNDANYFNTNDNLNILHNESSNRIENNNESKNNIDEDIHHLENMNRSYSSHDKIFYSNDKNGLNNFHQDDIYTKRKIITSNESNSYEKEKQSNKNKRSYLEINPNNTSSNHCFTYDYRKVTDTSKENCSTDLNKKNHDSIHKKTCLNNNNSSTLSYDSNTFSTLDEKINNHYQKCNLMETERYHINNEKKGGSQENIEDYQKVYNKRTYNNDLLSNNNKFEKNKNLILSSLNESKKKMEEINEPNLNNNVKNIYNTTDNNNSKIDNSNRSSGNNSSNSYSNNDRNSNNKNSIDNNNNNNIRNNNHNVIVNINEHYNVDNHINEKTNLKDSYKTCNFNTLGDEKNADGSNINENDIKGTFLPIEKDNFNNYNCSGNNYLNVERNECTYDKKKFILDKNKDNKEENNLNHLHKDNFSVTNIRNYNINNSFNKKHIHSNEYNISYSDVSLKKKNNYEETKDSNHKEIKNNNFEEIKDNNHEEINNFEQTKDNNHKEIKNNNYEEIKDNNYRNVHIVYSSCENDSTIQKNKINLISHKINISDQNYLTENNNMQKGINRDKIFEENQKEDALIRKKEDDHHAIYIKKNSMDNVPCYKNCNNSGNERAHHESNGEYDIKEKVNDRIEDVTSETYRKEFKNNNNTSNECNMKNNNFVNYANIEDSLNILHNQQNKKDNLFLSPEVKNNYPCMDNEQKDIKDDSYNFLKHKSSYELNSFNANMGTYGNINNTEDINKYSNNTICNFKNELNDAHFIHKNLNNENSLCEMADIKSNKLQNIHKSSSDKEVKRKNIDNLYEDGMNPNYNKISVKMNKNEYPLNCNKLSEDSFLKCKKNNEINYPELYSKYLENCENYNYVNNLDKKNLKSDNMPLYKKKENMDNERVIKKKNIEEKMEKEKEEETFDYYYEKTLEFLNEEFYSNKVGNLNDRDILEKTPFFKLVNFEKKLAAERKRVLNYYNEDKKQIYSNNINKDKQFSHIFHNNEKYYDAKEILAYLLPYHTFYLDEICIEPYKEDKNISKKLEKDIRIIEEEIYKIKDSFYTFTNPSIVWSFNKKISRVTNQFNKKKKKIK